MSRRIIALLAVSADGFIARPDGAVDWLDRPWPKGQYGLPEFVKSIDTLIMGRETYEVGKKLGGGPTMKGTRTIVFSHSRRDDDKAVEIVGGDVGPIARVLKAAPGKDIWLMGGAKLFGAFLDADQLDELVVSIIPVLIGEGIPLFDAKRRNVELQLLDHQSFSDGVVQLRWRPAR